MNDPVTGGYSSIKLRCDAPFHWAFPHRNDPCIYQGDGTPARASLAGRRRLRRQRPRAHAYDPVAIKALLDRLPLWATAMVMARELPDGSNGEHHLRHWHVCAIPATRGNLEKSMDATGIRLVIETRRRPRCASGTPGPGQDDAWCWLNGRFIQMPKISSRC